MINLYHLLLLLLLPYLGERDESRQPVHLVLQGGRAVLELCCCQPGLRLLVIPGPVLTLPDHLGCRGKCPVQSTVEEAGGIRSQELCLREMSLYFSLVGVLLIDLHLAGSSR